MIAEIAAALTALDRLFSVITRAKRPSKDYRDARDADKRAAVGWLDAVRGCILKVRGHVQRGTDPTEATAELAEHAWNRNVPKTVVKLLGQGRTRSLQEQLRKLHHSVKRGHTGDLTKAQRGRVIRQLGEAAGRVKALADYARAHSND